MVSDKHIDKPLVSVIIVTYNEFEYIYMTIDTILYQDYPNIELIIADDGSTSFPEENIVNYITNNKKENIVDIRIFHNENNRGTVKNLNNAYKKANGMYLVSIAGDDEFYSPNVVSQIVDTFETQNYDFFITSRVCINDKDKYKIVPSKFAKKMVSRLDTREKQYKAAIVGEFYDVLSGSSTFFKKSFIDEWGYHDEKYCLLEDLPFYSVYLINKCISFDFDIIAIKYRSGGVSDSNNPHPIYLNDNKIFQETDMIRCVDEYDSFFKKKVFYTIERFWMKDIYSRIQLYFKHPFIFLSNVIYQLKSRVINSFFS